MKHKPRWRKILSTADMVCIVGAVAALTASIWLGYPYNEIALVLRGVYLVMLGVHLILHGILNWEEQRKLAIFDFATVALVCIAALCAILRS